MSRIGRMPITVPEGVDVKLDGNVITVKGKNGTLTRELNPAMNVAIDGSVITVTRPNDEKQNRSLHGLTVEGTNKIIVSGPDKQKVGQFAAEIREKRPPEPYKGKGIKYDYEVIRRKEGKTGAKKK